MTQGTDTSFCAFGAKTLIKYLTKITKDLENVRDNSPEDPEYVHQMRIASRRLRSALPLFRDCFTHNALQRWSREIKRITRFLGKARDTDVQLLFLEEKMKELPDPAFLWGIQRLHLRLSQKRQTLQAEIVRGLDHFNKSDLAVDMLDTLRPLLGKAALEKTPERSPSIYRVASEIGRTCMADVISYDSLIRDPRNITELHELRKSNKRLRYTLEFFAGFFDNKLEPFIEQVREIHSLLGEIHDCDVWKDLLPLFLEEEAERALEYCGNTRPMTKIRRGIDFLLEERTALRDKLYGDFIVIWDQNHETAFWDDLEKTLLQGMKNGIPEDPSGP
ncbi:MAG: CHAD domain-containing protein [Synergistales bacterium]|nr:CHAD domain-containing protein [Synergistales bacterium]